jgi:hypothetical protein
MEESLLFANLAAINAQERSQVPYPFNQQHSSVPHSESPLDFTS